ncbi:MAG: PQQ-binding-like beta-propeller repeat protein [Pirellulaceae bacterium]
MHRTTISFVLLTFVAVLLNNTAFGQGSDGSNWPQWRGSKWDSISQDRSLPADLSREKNLLWRTAMPGPAGSSPVVWGNTVFVTSVDVDSIVLLSIGESGEIKWKKTLDGRNETLRMDRANLASPSPMTDGEYVWATSGAGVLHCFDFMGNEKWKVDLQDRYGKFDIQFGMSTSPILYNNRIYMQLIEGSMRSKEPESAQIICLDASTGDEVWNHERKSDAQMENKHSYASPTIFDNGERQFLLAHGGDYLTAHALDDGHELFRVGGMNPEESYNPFLRFVSSPVCDSKQIIVPTAKSGPVLSVRPDLSGDQGADTSALFWTLDRGTPDVASPVLAGGFVYLCRETGLFAVLDAESGEEVFNERLFADKHRSTPVVVNNRLYVVDRKGDLFAIEGGKVPRVLTTISLGEETTASPAIAGGRLYVRTFDALYAFGNKK